MQTMVHRLPVFAAVLIIVGCASPFEAGPYADWIERDPPSWRAAETSAIHRRHTLATQTPDAKTPMISQDAGPDEYVRLALQHNPAIKAAEARVARLQARIPQVTSLDDPMFRVEPIGEMAETAAGRVDVLTSVSQKLPFPGKLETRGRIAAQDVAMAVQELENVRLTVVADTRRAFWSYYFSARGIEVIEADQKLLAQFKQIAESKYKAGTATQQDVLRASVELLPGASNS